MSEFLSAEVANLAARIECLEDRIAKARRQEQREPEYKTYVVDFARDRVELTTLRMELRELQQTVANIGRTVIQLSGIVETLALGD